MQWAPVVRAAADMHAVGAVDADAATWALHTATGDSIAIRLASGRWRPKVSSPNPISAIDDATTPAAIATAPSTVIHARLSHDSHRTRLASQRWVSSSSRGVAGAVGTAASSSG